MSAPWCGWMMLALLLCAVLGEMFQPGVISQAHASLLAQNDRTYTGGHAGFGVYAALCGLVIAMIVVKMLCNNLLDYTFQISRRFMPPYEQYGDITTIVAYILYPALLVMLRVDDLLVNRWLVGSVIALFLLMWLYRLARNYVQSFAALAYVVLYIGTLEILPLGFLFYLGSKTISIL